MPDFHYSRTVAGPQLDARHEARVWRATSVVQKARADLDVEVLAPHLAEDAVYEAQGVLTPLVGKNQIIDYLRDRFEFLRDLGAKQDIGSFLNGRVDLPQGADHPCLIFVAGGKRQALWVVSVADSGMISRIDILTVAPMPDEARQSGGVST